MDLDGVMQNNKNMETEYIVEYVGPKENVFGLTKGNILSFKISDLICYSSTVDADKIIVCLKLSEQGKPVYNYEKCRLQTVIKYDFDHAFLMIRAGDKLKHLNFILDAFKEFIKLK